MDFKTKKIRKHISSFQTTNSHGEIKKHRRINVKVPTIIFFTIIAFLLFGTIKALENIDYSVFLSIAGENLTKDENGNTNFLLLGTGGGAHEGADLTDTIMVASLNEKDKLVTIISVPRDLYVKDSLVGDSRINETYFNSKLYYDDDEGKALEYTKKKVEEVTGVKIQYFAKVDFQGFKDLIDALGGIDIYVTEAIYDTSYPKGETGLTEVFEIQKGLQHMDGETALKYARSRKTTSDFDRANRQQEIIYAIKEKALKTQTLLNGKKIEKLMDALKENIETNVGTGEILTLGAMAAKITKEKIVHKTIHDDPSRCGGLLYTPEKEQFGGAFVLLPAGGQKFIHRFVDINLSNPKIAREKARLQVLNGTKNAGIAGTTVQILERFCFDIVRYGNADSINLTKTTYYQRIKLDENGDVTNPTSETLKYLQSLIPGEVATEIPENYKTNYTEADIIIEMGSDYVNSANYMKDPFFALPPSLIPQGSGSGSGTITITGTGTTTETIK